MPVPLPPDLVGSVLPPSSLHVRQSIHSTCSAHTGLVCGPGLGLSCLSRAQAVDSSCGVGKVLGILLLLTPED